MESKQKFDSMDEQLAKLRAAFATGNRSALFDAMLLTAQLNGPEWIADAAMDVRNGLNSGHYRDANHALGWTTKGKAKRVTGHHRAKLRTKILAELVQYRLGGGSLSKDIYADIIASKLAVSIRDVVSVYKEYGKFIKALPKKRKNKADTYSFADITMPSATVSATA